MPRITCREAKERLERIRSYFENFKEALKDFSETGDEKILQHLEVVKGFMERDRNELRNGLSASMEQAKEILGKDFLGPEAVEKTWGVKLEAKNIPPIPFTTEDLERAKELGQFLILRMPFTVQVMERLAKEPLFTKDWFKQEGFYTKETCKEGWALVSKEPIPDTTDKNYIEQTQRMIGYLTTDVFKDQSIPDEYRKAIQEFVAKKNDLTILMRSNWEECAKRLSELQITKLTRPSAADAVYDLLVYKQNNDERLLENVYIWTSALDSGGSFVPVGLFQSGGMAVSGRSPNSARGTLGACLSRIQ